MFFSCWYAQKVTNSGRVSIEMLSTWLAILVSLSLILSLLVLILPLFFFLFLQFSFFFLFQLPFFLSFIYSCCSICNSFSSCRNSPSILSGDCHPSALTPSQGAALCQTLRDEKQIKAPSAACLSPAGNICTLTSSLLIYLFCGLHKHLQDLNVFFKNIHQIFLMVLL